MNKTALVLLMNLVRDSSNLKCVRAITLVPRPLLRTVFDFDMQFAMSIISVESPGLEKQGVHASRKTPTVRPVMQCNLNRGLEFGRLSLMANGFGAAYE